MKSKFLAACLAAVFVFVVAAPSAYADRSDCKASVENAYSANYHAVKHRFGARAPGRNIRLWGTSPTRRASCGDLLRSTRTLRRFLAPPVPAYHAGDTSSAHASTWQAGSGYAIPRYIVMCESGGNYRARNPSGAGGAYQIMPGTWSFYGGTGSDPAAAPPAEQDRVAGKIWAAEGSAPWACR